MVKEIGVIRTSQSARPSNGFQERTRPVTFPMCPPYLKLRPRKEWCPPRSPGFGGVLWVRLLGTWKITSLRIKNKIRSGTCSNMKQLRSISIQSRVLFHILPTLILFGTNVRTMLLNNQIDKKKSKSTENRKPNLCHTYHAVSQQRRVRERVVSGRRTLVTVRVLGGN